MSTPTGKPVNPIDPFAHVSHETHERAGPEHHPVEGDSEPIRSPYAPTRAGERASTERDAEKNDPLRSLYAPKKARTQPTAASDVSIRDDGVPLVPPRGPESYLFSHNPDSDSVLQLAHSNSQRHEQAAAARPDASIRDLKRLKATLRWIQREGAAARIPRAAQLPPVSGLAPTDVRGRRHSDEMLEVCSVPSLEPERKGPPPAMRSRRHKLRAPLIVLIASIFAAPIGYYFSVRGWSPSSQPARGPQMASLGAKTHTPPSSIRQQELPRTTTSDDDRGMSARDEMLSQRPETPQPRQSSEGEAMAMVQPSATGARAPPSSKAIRVLDPEEIKLLMKQGEQLIAAGDVVTARTVFRRAADAGNANAAIALGATYDPSVLAKLGVVGVSADVEKARSWYQKAADLGSPDARGRLDVLADH
jgi:hypothetical protein